MEFSRAEETMWVLKGSKEGRWEEKTSVDYGVIDGRRKLKELTEKELNQMILYLWMEERVMCESKDINKRWID